MHIPICNKPNRGAQPKTKSALERQPSDIVETEEAQIESDKDTFQRKRTNVEAQQKNSDEILPTTSKNIDKLCEK
ncbi:unnamed protein product [Brachionus calyciflorus]|uniref:Uncharacterized protein n=1 Tax=Brachionus calyciflorus TaxID=104777 RepID=A0A814B583_9BILA|nr:unnamed protein product [Brachionus calyciflorus]